MSKESIARKKLFFAALCSFAFAACLYLPTLLHCVIYSHILPTV